MFKRNNKNVNHNKYMNGPDIIYRSSDIIVHIIMTILMMVVFLILCFFVFREGVDNLLLNGTLNILLLLFTVIGAFLLVIFSSAMIFPIYINEYGALFRTLFLKKKFLNWNDVEDIYFLKLVDYSSNNIMYRCIINSRKELKLSWSIEIKKNDDYYEILNIIDFYVKKHNIKIRFKDLEFNFNSELKEIPKTLDFSN